MQIKVNLQIFIFIIIFILTNQIEIYAILMLFAFIHELGHLIAGVLLGLVPKSLHIMPFGISIVFKEYESRKRVELRKIIIASAGPITNLVIVLITVFLNIKIELKEMIIYSNILIACFNLIPLYPLDGGRVLKSFLRLKLKPEKSEMLTNKISNILLIGITGLCSLLIFYYKNIAFLFVVIYLWIIMAKENKNYNLKKKVYKVIKNKNIDI